MELAKDFIESEGLIQVDVATSVGSGLDLLNRRRYDAIVSDYLMPESNGIDLLKVLRERGDKTPFILFTGKGREEIVIEALNNGADFYLQKGGDLKSQFAELTNMIRQLVSQRRSEMALRESEERYRSFINNFKGIAFRAGLDSIPIFFHGAVKAITGYTEEEFTEGRMRWSRVVHPDDLPTFLRLSEDLIKTPGFSTVREYRIVRKDGQVRWVLESIANIVDDSGRIQAVEGVMHDITDRKTAEDAIAHNLEHFKAIIENTSDIIAIIDQDRIIRYASPSVTRTLGYEPKELMDVRLLDLIHPDDIDYLEETISKVFTGEQVEATKNFRIRSKTGSWVLLEATSRLSNSFDRGPRIIVNARETIEPRRAEDTLASNDWEFLESVEGTTDGIAIIQDSVLKCVNKRLLEIGGYAVEEVLGKNFTDLIWPDEVPRAAELYKKRMARDHFLSVHETALKRKDGTKQHVELTAGAIMYEGNPADFLIVHDISERKGVERELLDSRETYRAIFENTGTATIIAEEDMTISMANKEFETLSGCSKQDIEEKRKWTEFVVKEDLPKMMEFHRLRRIDRGASPLRYEFKFLDKNQNVHDIQLSVDVIKGTKKSVASLQDVTDLKRIGRELEMQNQNQRMLLDNIETMVWYVVDPETYGMVNRARAEFIGKRREELEGKKLREVISVKEEFETCIASNTAAFEGKEIVRTEEWITTSKGKRLVSVTKTPMFDENGNVEFIVCTGIDITERKMLGKELLDKSNEQALLLDNIQTMVYFATDPETHGKMNQARADFFGKSKEEIEGKKISELMPKDLADVAIAGNRYVFETKRPYHGLEWHTDWKREKHLFSVTKIPKLDEKGNVEFVICTAHDVTDLEEARNALSLANKKLNLYGSILRHDTLNKLSVILGNAGLAEEQSQDTRLKRYLENIRRAAKAIGKEMEFAKEYEDVGAKAPVWNSLGNCLSKASIGLDLRDISLTVDLDGIEILADPMLDRVFHNLIDNACRHGGEVKTINIRHERSGDDLKLICEDDGVGITEKNKEELFSPGHALQMVRDILAITDMTIAEKGEYGKGARFEICVPAGNFRFVD